MSNNVHEISIRNNSFNLNACSPLKELENYIKSLGKELAIVENKKNSEKKFEENLQKILKSSPQKTKTQNLNKSQSQLFQQQLRTSSTHLNQSTEVNRKSSLDERRLKLIQLNEDSKNMTIYEKNFNKEVIKERKLEFLREKKINTELSYMKSKVNICKKSINIINSKLKDIKPIYERSFEIIEKKQEKVAKIRSSSNESKQNYLIKSSKYNQNKFENWLKTNEDWNLKKQNKLLVTKELQEKVFENDMKSFYKPRINTVSKNKTFSDSKCFIRLFNFQEKLNEKKETLYKKYTPSFTPKLIKKNKNFIYLKKGGNFKESKEIFNEKRFTKIVIEGVPRFKSRNIDLIL